MPLGVTNHGTVEAAVPFAFAAMLSWSCCTPTRATPVVLAAPSASTAALILAATCVQLASPLSGNRTESATMTPPDKSAEARVELRDRPHSSSRITVTADFTPASAIVSAIKRPCRSVLTVMRNTLSSATASVCASEPGLNSMMSFSLA